MRGLGSGGRDCHCGDSWLPNVTGGREADQSLLSILLRRRESVVE